MVQHKLLVSIGLLLLALFLVPAHAASPPQPTNMVVAHRSGQTFVTWTERSSLEGEYYRIYRHTQPINKDNLDQATRLFEVAKGSGNFYADRYNRNYSGNWRTRYVDRFVIQNLGEQLPANTGLLVWTLAPVDFQGENSGPAYYAVTTVDTSGTENVLDFTSANTQGPVQESVDDPSPVEIREAAGGLCHVYTQFMDLRHWNPTFHAPNPLNQYYGLNSRSHAVANSVQYAYAYTVGEPNPANCPSPMPETFPLVLYLHGWDDNTYNPELYPSQYYCAFEVRPIDVSETWWFGFAQKQDYRKSAVVKSGDTIVNFTEARVMRMIYDLLRNPAIASRIDRSRIYEYGHSMGGSGALALALRYPNLFAAAYASEPMTNYRTSVMWRSNVWPKWGSPSLNLPVLLTGPGDWAAHLARYDGTGAWDWQNHQRNMRRRAGDDFVPLGMAHGRRDEVIDWNTQAKPAYGAFDASRHAWGGAVTDDDHTWLGFAGLLPNYAMDASTVPFAGMTAVLNETVPGLSNASGNLPLPPPDPPGPTGVYNASIEWSASWSPWDGHPTDRAALWAVSLRTTDGSTRIVDVTPRRLHKFKVVPSTRYRWQNRKVTDNSLVASGVVQADTRSLVTIPGLRVTPGGNRIRLIPLNNYRSLQMN